MKKIYLALCVMLFIGSDSVVSADEELPEWITREQEVWVDEGIIYARASAKMATVMVSINAAETRARSNISRALANNEITAYSAIPADTKTRTTLTFDNKSFEVGRIAVIERFIANDNTAYILLLCIGAEIKRTEE
jgi:hypothetical protein